MKAFSITFGIGQDASGKPITHSDYTLTMPVVLSRTAGEFGGYTLTAGIGGWLNPDNSNLIEEPVKILSIATDKPAAFCDEFARWVGNQFSQHSVLFTFNGEAELLECNAALSVHAAA